MSGNIGRKETVYHGHSFDAKGRVYCHAWDEMIDFETDQWEKDNPCPWCGENYTKDIIEDYREKND